MESKSNPAEEGEVEDFGDEALMDIPFEQRNRRLKYGRPQDLQEAVEQYFKTLKGPPTMSGLQLSLGMSETAFYAYRQRPGYRWVVERARLMIEEYYEQGLSDPSLRPGSTWWLERIRGRVPKAAVDTGPALPQAVFAPFLHSQPTEATD